MALRQLPEDNQDRWYVPDPNRAQDLEWLREFRQYTEGKERLKVFRKEAIMAGFRRAWWDKDYATIVQVARHLPSRVLEEDTAFEGEKRQSSVTTSACLLSRLPKSGLTASNPPKMIKPCVIVRLPIRNIIILLL